MTDRFALGWWKKPERKGREWSRSYRRSRNKLRGEFVAEEEFVGLGIGVGLDEVQLL